MPGSPRKDKPNRFTRRDFEDQFPDDAACLDYLWRRLYSADGEHAECPSAKCQGRTRKFHRVKNRAKSYSCDSCGHHLHPTAGTIFHKSTTPLKDWFLAIFLLSATRCGISAKQIEREIGVTYKTAWRMHNRIRQLLEGDDVGEQLTGEVEIDETAYGRRPRASDGPMTRREGTIWAQQHKTTVFAMVERGGRVRAFVVPDRSKATLHGEIMRHVSPDATIYTDEWALYRGLSDHFKAHYQIKHADRVYARGHVHTQTIEGFFGNVKRGISGVYHHVSPKYLTSYVTEYAFRYNHRDDQRPMFKAFLGGVRVDRPRFEPAFPPKRPRRPGLAS